MTDLDVVRRVYEQIPARVAKVRRMFGRPLTLTEKVLGAHLCDLDGRPPGRLETTVDLAPDRVAMQDATAQMAILQFMRSGRRRTAVPTTVHCDHLIRAEQGAKDDMLVALDENHEVYSFLGSAALKYGMGFWKPGSGIIHQVVLENYAFPGGMMIGTDSHTPNAGGLGMIAIGVGGADAVDVMVGEPFGLLWPGVIGVRLTGRLGGWTSPKDIILKLMGILTVKGGTNCIVEFFGPGTASVSATGKGTVCNMGAEHGATTSIFPYDERMATYLRATGRAEIARLADGIREHLTADSEAIAQPERYYDRIIDIDLSTLEPMIVGPHSPDVARPISQMARDVREQDYPDEFTYGLIGSCTNSSYEDMDRAALVARQAREKGLKLAKPLLVTPGSDQIHNTIQRDGQTAVLEEVGATVLANACGPCIGQWRRTDPAAGKRNSILNSYNRNFKRRNDGSAETLSFIGSPEIVTALTFAGRLSFNPLTDSLRTPDGREFRFSPPAEAAELPQRGFAEGLAGYQKPADDSDKVQVIIDPNSERLQALEPFPAWEGRDLTGLVLLLQAEGKCTTDHISAAGPWLKYRGHLDRISDNAFLGAVNRFGGVINGIDSYGFAVGQTSDGLGFVYDPLFGRPELFSDYALRTDGTLFPTTITSVNDVFSDGTNRYFAVQGSGYLYTAPATPAAVPEPPSIVLCICMLAIVGVVQGWKRRNGIFSWVRQLIAQAELQGSRPLSQWELLLKPAPLHYVHGTKGRLGGSQVLTHSTRRSRAYCPAPRR